MAPWWLRKAHWLMTALFAGFAMWQVNLTVPHIATEAVGGVGVCPPHEIFTSEACKQARSEGQGWFACNQGIKALASYSML